MTATHLKKSYSVTAPQCDRPLSCILRPFSGTALLNLTTPSTSPTHKYIFFSVCIFDIITVYHVKDQRQR